MWFVESAYYYLVGLRSKLICESWNFSSEKSSLCLHKFAILCVFEILYSLFVNNRFSKENVILSDKLLN